MFDVLIKNIKIIDGTGSKPLFEGMVGIRGDEIGAVEEEIRGRGKIEVDGKGLYLAPGFIDIHNKSDSHLTILSQPLQGGLLKQGITTVLAGNCGSSLAPLNPRIGLEGIQKWATIKETNLNWLKPKDFLDFLSSQGIGINFATLVGHNTMRRNLIGDERRALTFKELKRLEFMTEEALEAGFWGVSSGLEYAHGSSITKNEIISLLKIIKKSDLLYSVHLRDEADKLLTALNKIINLVNWSEIKRVQISHLKASGKVNWSRLKEALVMMEGVRKSKIYFDTYPYTTIAKALYLFLPSRAKVGKSQLIKMLGDEKEREAILEEMKDLKHDYDKMTVASSPTNPVFQGKSLADIASRQGKDIRETVLDLILATSDQIVVFYDALSEENVAAKLNHPLGLISVGGPGFNQQVVTDALIHPRSFGAMPRLLNWVLNDKLGKKLSLEKAVAKLTSLPAAQIGFKDRGVIAKGKKADLVFFGADIKDMADFSRPTLSPRGIERVMINGKIVLEKGEIKESKEGRVLRRG